MHRSLVPVRYNQYVDIDKQPLSGYLMVDKLPS